MKRIINFIRLWMALRKKEKTVTKMEREMQDRMTCIDETMALKEVSETYARYVCMMHGWESRLFGGYTDHFCAISFALMDGYIKAMHDNGYEFQNGLVKKRDIMNEMPCGALDYYRKDAIADTKEKAVETLKQVMEKYETSKQNINVIVNDFENEINKEN